ncbi:four helix bundle protein [Bizionia sediminis]|uniref:Four helix bundle protein n=1 Tax=Bizionia sediminis TaxID=1737064 RepID=A0ABW5KQK2_9FLAO
MHRFEALKTWQKAMDITEYCYRASENFLKKEKYGLTSQFRRSAVSNPSNITEGAGRNTNGEFRQFLGIVKGASFELRTELYLLKRLKLITEEKVRPILSEILEVTKMNYALQKSLMKS